MADFDLEQLKTLFENLGDRLEQTEGDTDLLTETQKMRTLMALMAKTMAQSAKPGGHRRENKEFIDQFWTMWKQQNPLGSLKNTAPTKTPEGTILQQVMREQKARAKGQWSKADADTYVNKFHKNITETGSHLNRFGSDIRKAGGGVSDFFSNLKKGGIMAALGGGEGSILGKIGGAANDMIDSYRKLKQAGDGSVGSIQEMNTAANSAYMSASELADAFQKAGDSTKKLGALRFVQLQSALIGSTRGANQLQMSFDDYKKATDDYTSILASRGQLFDQNNTQMVDGIKRMVKSSETTASILGKTRDEALKARADANQDSAATDLARRRGVNMESFANSKTLIKQVFGDAGNELFNSLTNHSAFTTAGAQLAGTNQEAYKAILAAANRVSSTKEGDNSDKTIQQQVASGLKAYGNNMYNSRQGETIDQLAEFKSGTNSSVMAANVDSIMAARNLNLTPPKDPAKDSGTNSAQDIRDQERILANEANRAITAFFNPILNDPKLMQNLYDDFKALTGVVHDMVSWMAAHPKVMEYLGIAVVATTGLFAALNVALGIMITTLGIFKSGSLLKNVAGGLLGRGGGAGAAGGLGNRARSILGTGAGEAAGTGVAATAATILGGLAVGVGGSYLAGRQMDKRKGESLFGQGDKEKGFVGSRGSAYLAAAGSGAAGGALIGSVVPVIGTAVGAAVGGVLGLGYAGIKDYLAHDGTTKPIAAVKGPPKSAVDMHARLLAAHPVMNRVAPQVRNTYGTAGANLLAQQVAKNDNARNAAQKILPPGPAKPALPTNATPGKKLMTMDEMTNKVMESSEKAAMHLKQIKDNTDSQIALMREDIAMSRNHNEKVQRLLEEGNRNTKRAADRTV